MVRFGREPSPLYLSPVAGGLVHIPDRAIVGQLPNTRELPKVTS